MTMPISGNLAICFFNRISQCCFKNLLIKFELTNPNVFEKYFGIIIILYVTKARCQRAFVTYNIKDRSFRIIVSSTPNNEALDDHFDYVDLNIPQQYSIHAD